MRNHFFFLLVLYAPLTFGQAQLTFSLVGKTPAFIGSGFGATVTPTSLFVRDWENYYLYSFAAGTWTKLKFERTRLRKMKGATRITSVFLPEYEKIVTNSDALEIVDVQTLDLTYIDVTDGAPVLGGSAAWKEKIYFFGGFITMVGNDSRMHTVESDLVVVLDPATLTFRAVGYVPGIEYSLGTFIGDKLYIFGARSSSDSTSLIRYNPVTHQTEKLGRFPGVVSAIAQEDQTIYVLGLRDGSGSLTTYNTVSAKAQTYSTNIHWATGIALIRENKLYFMAGIEVNPVERKVMFKEARWLTRKMYMLDLGTLP